MKKTSTYHHGNLKESLLSTAMHIVEDEGIDAITLRELSRRIGTSRSAVYRHFESKEALLKELIELGYAKLNELFTPIFGDKSRSVDERFWLMNRTYVEFAIAHPNLYRLLYSERFREEREGICDYRKKMQSIGLYALSELLIEAQENGIIEKADPHIQIATIFASVHGFSLLLIDGYLMMSDNFEEIFRHMNISLLLRLRIPTDR